MRTWGTEEAVTTLLQIEDSLTSADGNRRSSMSTDYSFESINCCSSDPSCSYTGIFEPKYLSTRPISHTTSHPAQGKVPS